MRSNVPLQWAHVITSRFNSNLPQKFTKWREAINSSTSTQESTPIEKAPTIETYLCNLTEKSLSEKIWSHEITQRTFRFFAGLVGLPTNRHMLITVWAYFPEIRTGDQDEVRPCHDGAAKEREGERNKNVNGSMRPTYNRSSSSQFRVGRGRKFTERIERMFSCIVALSCFYICSPGICRAALTPGCGYRNSAPFQKSRFN